MPTVELYTPPAVADASYAVRAPGGYESWTFDAQDSAGGLFLRAAFHYGYIFDRDYLWRYRRFLRRPTRLKPPLPADAAWAELAVYQTGQLVEQFVKPLPPSACAAATDRIDVRLGPNVLQRQADGIYRLHLEDVRLSADLVFQPELEPPPVLLPLLAPEQGHHWLICAPLCRVSGSIAVGPGARRLEFRGLGYHDHRLGTGPLAPLLSQWSFARALMDDSVLILQRTTDVDGEQTVGFLEAGPDAVHRITDPAAIAEAEAALTVPVPVAPDFFVCLAGDVTIGARSGLALSWSCYPSRRAP